MQGFCVDKRHWTPAPILGDMVGMADTVVSKAAARKSVRVRVPLSPLKEKPMKLPKKKCGRCGKVKDARVFIKRMACLDGKGSWCKKCSREYTKARYVSKQRVVDKCKRCKTLLKGSHRVYCSRTCKSRAYNNRDRYLKTRFGITVEDYESILLKQDGKCAICRRPPNEGRRNSFVLCVDHCHHSNRIRGLLCFRCNVAIGLLSDDPEMLKRTMAYLQKGGERELSQDSHTQPTLQTPRHR